MLPLPSNRQCLFSVAFSHCGRWLAAGGSDGAVDVWDLYAPQKFPVRLRPESEPVVRVEFTADGRLLAHDRRGTREYDTGGWSGAADPDTDWRATEGGAITNNTLDYLELRWPGAQQIAHIPISPRPLRVAYSADGTRAAVLANGNLSVWDLESRAPVVDRTSPTHGGWLSLAFAPNGQRVVTGGIDSTVGVWDAVGGPPLRTFQWGVGPVYAVAFDRDGLRAAAAGHSGAIVWDVDE